MAILAQSKGNILEAAALSLILAMYNNLINLLPRQLHDHIYVPVNLSFMSLLRNYPLVA